jgi:hypothetical protein
MTTPEVKARAVTMDRYEVLVGGDLIGFAWYDDSVQEWRWRVDDHYGKGRDRDDAVIHAAKYAIAITNRRIRR